MTLASIPVWLRLWLVLQAASYVVGPLLDPDPGSSIWIGVGISGVLSALLGWAMWKHAKGAWLVAVFFAIWSLLGALPVLVVWREGFDRDFLWYLWGLALGVTDLAILLSRPARDWVNEPTQRAWAYAPDHEKT